MIILLNIPYVQRKVATIVSTELSHKLNTTVQISKIDIGLMNRIIIDDVLLNDQSGKKMLKVARLSAKFEIMPLFKGKIAIRSVQLFGFNINLNKNTPNAPLNCQFVIDAFASKDTLKKKSNIDLRINSVLIRRGTFNFDVLSEVEKPTKFNAKHIRLTDIFANISLKALQKDSINASIKRLSLTDQSGFELRKLTFKVTGNTKGAKIENFIVGLPQTEIRLATVHIKYDGFKAFKNFMNDVSFSTKILPSYITLQNISPFVPAFINFRDKVNLEMKISGTINQLTSSDLKINAGDNDLSILGGATFQDLEHAENTYLFGKIKQLSLNRAGMDFIVRNFAKEYSGTPNILKRIGQIGFKGEISGYFDDFVTYGTFTTSLGVVKTDVKFSANKKVYTYSGAVKTGKFNIGKLLNSDKLGNTALNLAVNCTHIKGAKPDLKLKGLITSLDYSGYEYKNITIDGRYFNGGFNGEAALNDNNGNVHVTGKINLYNKIPTFNIHACIDKIRPFDLRLTKKYKNSTFSLNVNANFQGKSIDDMIGEINVDSFAYSSPEKEYFFNNLNISAKQQIDKKIVELNSDFLKVKVEGKYSYKTIPMSILKTVERYIPSLLSINKKNGEPHNDFNFIIDIYNSDILNNVFNIPLSVKKHTTIKGFFNDNDRKLKIEGYFPSLQYNNLKFESGLLLCESATNQFKCQIRANNRLKKGGVVSLSLESHAQNDKLHTSINWGNNALSTYSGQFSTITNFFKTAGKNPILQAKIDIEPTTVILNDSVWNINASHVEVDSGRVYVNNFLFEHKDQFIHIDGKITKEINDTLKVNLNDINIGYVFDIVNLKSVDFTGVASGNLYINQALKSPIMNTRLHVKDFAFNKATLGDMNIFGEWDKEKQGIFLNAKIAEPNISESKVVGYIFPGKKSLDLAINANNTNLGFLETYLQSITSNIKGRASGNIRLYGEFNALNLQGSAKANASFKVNILNTIYAIKDSIKLSPNEISINNIAVYDPEGHSGIVNGYVRHEHFKNMNYRIHVDAKNLLSYNTKENSDLPFYGTAYGTGNVLLTGNNSGLNVDVAMSTNKNSTFVYKMSSIASATNNQFVTFVDKTPKRILQDSTLIDDYEAHNSDKTNESSMDVHLNMLIDATPDASMKIIIDPISNDYIIGKGTGNIRMEFYNKGDIKMFGNYTLDHGTYKFSLQEVIRKDFNIKSGSTVSFNGNPLNANLDMKASYTVNSVSLADLGSEVPDDIKQSNVKVNCLMDISGILLHPTIKLGIELPNESEEKQRIVQNVISTDDQINMQTLYLLGIGKFYTADYTNAAQNSSAVSSVISSTLSGQLNNMLSQVLNSNNWNIGVNGSTGTKGWTDMEFEGMLSGQLLNNRLLINGNFGYRKNPAVSNSFIGNFDVEWLLTKSGEVRLKAYNQSNDRYYTRTTLNTQGLGIMYKKDFNTWFELLPWYKKDEGKSQPKDSIPPQKKEIIAPTSTNTPNSKKKRER